MVTAERVLLRLRPALEAHGDWGTVRELAEETLAEGSAARRMRRTARREDLLGCVDMLIAETRGERGGRRPARAGLSRTVVAPTRPLAGPEAPDVVGR